MQPAVADLRIVGWLLGQCVMALAVVMLVPLGYSLFTAGANLRTLVLSAVITAVSGGVLLGLSRRRQRREIKQREAILVVVLVWICICFFGCLPFYFSPWYPNLTDAFFEAASGFTTTGATVLDRVEVLSQPIQLWRCLSHWLGGMGIVLLGLAILPLVGEGGMHLYEACKCSHQVNRVGFNLCLPLAALPTNLRADLLLIKSAMMPPAAGAADHPAGDVPCQLVHGIPDTRGAVRRGTGPTRTHAHELIKKIFQVHRAVYLSASCDPVGRLPSFLAPHDAQQLQQAGEEIEDRYIQAHRRHDVVGFSAVNDVAGLKQDQPRHQQHEHRGHGQR
jgi:Cation transport protein